MTGAPAALVKGKETWGGGGRTGQGDGRIRPTRKVETVATSAATSQILSRASGPTQVSSALSLLKCKCRAEETHHHSLQTPWGGGEGANPSPEETSDGILTGPGSSGRHFSATGSLGTAELRFGLPPMHG